MTQAFKISVKPILITCLLGAALSQTACTQSKTEAGPPQESIQTSTLFTVAHVDAKGAQALLASNPEAVVLDVRTPKEIQGGHIEGAVFADFMTKDFAQKLTKLDRDTPYIVHCKGGGRSKKALTALEGLGFTNITHLDGGLDDWKRASLPLITPVSNK